MLVQTGSDATDPHKEEGFMSQSEKLRGRTTQVTGRVKEMAGRATGNNRLRNRGRFEMFKGRALTRTAGWKDSVRGTLRSLRSPGR